MVKKAFKKLNLLYRRMMKSNDKNIYFSLGENCLTDDILERFGLKSFSSPYSSGRSNIEYILAFERESFADLLEPAFLRYEEAKDGKRVVRNKKYVDVKNKYHTLCTNGFEFTHHDPLKKKDHAATMKRRYERLLNLKNKNVFMLYHHRMHSDTDEKMLEADLQSLAEIYEERDNNVFVYVFYQEIVEDPAARRIERKEKCIKKDRLYLITYKFYTIHEWAGTDQDIFWARSDDDLLKEMIDDMRSRG